MGYTHYWTKKVRFTAERWVEVSTDIQTILKVVEHEQGIALAGPTGEGGTRPIFDNDDIAFNGLGDDSHETLHIARNSTGWTFCKTARKPYDVAVTAVLAYLSTVADFGPVTSDGHGADWLDGVEMVRRALPATGNIVDIPRAVMEADRWFGPWVDNRSARYAMHFCVDGKAYIIRLADQRAYVFANHKEAAAWAQPYEDLLRPTGSFDKARWTRITRAQTRLFKEQFERGEMFQPEQMGYPPLFVRPDQFPAPAHRAYYFSDLLAVA